MEPLFVRWENSNYRYNFGVPGLPIFSKFFWVTLNYTLSISYSPRALAIGGKWNVKIIESPLPYSLYIDLFNIGQYIIIHILVVKRTLHLRANPKDSTIKPTNEVISRDRFEQDSTLYSWINVLFLVEVCYFSQNSVLSGSKRSHLSGSSEIISFAGFSVLSFGLARIFGLRGTITYSLRVN